MDYTYENSKYGPLRLGWCQGYMALEYHMQEAYEECGRQDSHEITANPTFALFSHKYVNDMEKITREKKYDFCFIGDMDTSNKCALCVGPFQ